MSSSVASPSTSPPTPPSPLPVSVGPGNQRYAFTPSPPFSPPCPSSPTAPLLSARSEPKPTLQHSSAFSVHTRHTRPPRPRQFDLGAWCLEWMLKLLCCCSSKKMRD